MSHRARLVLAASLALLAVPATAHAQPPATSTAASSPDVVKLRDGSMFRGTISELVAKDHVDLVLPSGQTRRFPMADVAYAGTATAAPGAAPAPPPVIGPSGIGTSGPRADLHFEANEPDVQFQLQTGHADIVGVGWGGGHSYSYMGQANAYQTICTAPCAASLPAGTQRIGLSHDGGRVVEPDHAVEVTGSGTLQGTYTSHSGVRVAGLVVAIASLGGGLALMLTSLSSTQSCTSNGAGGQDCIPIDSFNTTQFAIGAGVAIVGSIVGTVLMFRRDTAEITFVPMGAVGNVGAREMTALAPALFRPQGLAMNVRF